MFRGSLTALITPFRDGGVDERAFESLVEWQIAEGINGIVPCGTTGKSPTLSHVEHRRVTEIAVAVAKKRVPVIAGAGSNSTQEAIALARHAENAGADAVLCVVPYYNKPTQEGLYRHFRAIHDSCGLPIIIYNIPPRVVIDMTVETMARLAELPRIAGSKDSTMDLTRPTRTKMAIQREFSLLSGEDGTALAFVAQGGHGCISVTANVAPRLTVAMHDAWRRGDAKAAQEIHLRLFPLHHALFLEPNPAPIKYAASLLGRSTAEVRLPLCEVGEATKARVREAMVHAGLIEPGERRAAE